MATPDYDVLVLGGGPAGSTAGAFLAMAGRRVVILERETFPRFHIGESLLPYNQLIFEELGVKDSLRAAGFPRKLGAQFHIGNGSKSLRVRFREGRFNHHWEAFQVERSVFDDILLRNAADHGAEPLEGWEVKEVENGASGVRVTAACRSGERREFTGRYLVDATGRSNLTGNRDGLRVSHPHLKKLALFGHYRGVALDDGDHAGDIVIVRQQEGWFWLIPLGEEKASVGYVMDAAAFPAMGLKPGPALDRVVAGCPVMRERMERAEPVMPVQSTTDYSYCNRRLVGSRLLRVGDAAGFVDPVFSSGVYLAMDSGRRAAETIGSLLRGHGNEERALRKYEKATLAAMEFYREMVEGFYTQPFMEVLMEPRDFLSLPDAVNAALAGDLSSRWAIRWRLRMFFRIVRRQARRRVAPAIHFE